MGAWDDVRVGDSKRIPIKNKEVRPKPYAPPDGALKVEELSLLVASHAFGGEIATGQRQYTPIERDGSSAWILLSLILDVLNSEYVSKEQSGLIGFVLNLTPESIQSILLALEPRISDPTFRQGYAEAMRRQASACYKAGDVLNQLFIKFGGGS